MTKKTSPLGLGSCMVVLALDWLVYAVTMATFVDALWYGIAGGATLTALLVYLFERGRGESQSATWLKALACAAAVALPLPLVGTLLAAVGLAWLMIARGSEVTA